MQRHWSKRLGERLRWLDILNHVPPWSGFVAQFFHNGCRYVLGFKRLVGLEFIAFPNEPETFVAVALFQKVNQTVVCKSVVFSQGCYQSLTLGPCPF